MFIRGYEKNILHNLIGRKARAVIIPESEDGIPDPTEAMLVLSDRQAILFDSCAREQAPTETPVDYPQMRVRMIDSVPEHLRGLTIDLDQNGEIIRNVAVINEEISSPDDIASYTKAVHIEFSGDRDVTITRETFRNPSLKVFEKGNWKEETETQDPFASTKLISY